MAEIDPDVAANYEALRESRGWSYQTLAEHFDGSADAADLAAWARSQAGTDPNAAPVDRAAPAPDQTADAVEPEQTAAADTDD